MRIPFTKMHGIGNDFVVFNGIENTLPNLAPYAAKICDRRFGIGCDQLLLIHPSERADFRMQIFNHDGGEVEMCGNGIRCIAKYLLKNHLTTKTEISIDTPAGIMHPRVIENEIEVDMGEPILEGPKIPVQMEGKIIQSPLKINGTTLEITCVSMGNPHCVLFVEDVSQAPVTTLGPLLERHSLFPNRINVEFVHVVNPTSLKMRVWERGAGETLACGTGACAALVASVLTGKSDRAATLHLKGGELKIRWSEKNNRVYMIGPATEVYTGIIELN